MPKTPTPPDAGGSTPGQTPPWAALGGPFAEYVTDATQRTVLFLDVLRRRSEDYYEHKAMEVPHVLSFDAELVLDGRTLERPANYLLVRVKPPEGVVTDPKKRPFVVVDPRAGHGPGSGASRRTARSGWRRARATCATSSASPPNPCPGRPSRM